MATSNYGNLTFDERTLRSKLGVQVISHELGELFSRAGNVNETAVTKTALAMTEVARGRVEISDRDLRMSASIYLAMHDFVHEHGYDALAVSDWPAFQNELQIHPGMAFSWLDDKKGIPVASEGDVLGAISMLLLREVGGGQAMLLDMNDVDETRQAVLMWHCGGSPLGFADDTGISWKNHSTLGRKSNQLPMGAVADLVFRAQDATIVRLANDAKQLFVVEARIIESPHKGFEGSRGWLTDFTSDGEDMKLADLLNTIMTQGIEHHFVLSSGHHANVLREFASWLDIDTIKTTPYRTYMQRSRS